ncbi:MAG: hypothetical protein M1451_01295, partial [Acidobacteria bacterium]|nr:hypothetical protein [Acidobacteriota bacterium]
RRITRIAAPDDPDVQVFPSEEFRLALCAHSCEVNSLQRSRKTDSDYSKIPHGEERRAAPSVRI